MAVRWPEGWCALLAPEEAVADGLELGAPAPCKAGSVSYWSLGGPGKARLRVLEDEKKLLHLGESFTVGLVFRAGAGSDPGHDSVLLGHDNKHWLSLEGGKRTLAIVDAGTGKTFPLGHQVSTDAWSVIFLQSRSEGTAVLTFDEDGLVELGVFGIFLAGSRLRSLGWASNEVQVAQVAVWKSSLPWGEMLGSLAQEPPAAPLPDPDDPPAKPRRMFRGQVVDTLGMGLDEVKVSWRSGDCVTDEDGCFEASLSDAETDVPDTASAGSAGSTDSWLSLSFSREGFAPVAMPAQGVPGEQSSLQVTLRPVSASESISAEKGGAVTDPASGSSVSVPPNGLCYPDGSPVTGEVTVSLSVIDATDPASLASMPGDFSAVAADGSTVFLQSLGAAWVGAVDEAGRELVVNQDSPGVTLDLKSNATVDAEKLGTLPDMWTFDEASGKWEVEQTAMQVDGEPVPNPGRPVGEASASDGETNYGKKKYKGKSKAKARTYVPEGKSIRQGGMSPEDFKAKVKNGATKSLTATVKKMGYINCDIAYMHPITAVMMTGKVLGHDGKPLANSQLWSVGRDYGGRCPDATDSEGKFGKLIAQFDSDVDVEVHVREEATDGKKLEIYYKDFPRKMDKEMREVFDLAVGPHWQGTAMIEGQPTWSRTNSTSLKGKTSKVAWCPRRRQWQHTLDGHLAFVRDEPEETPALPFGPGWRMAASFKTSFPACCKLFVGAPIYERATLVKKHMAGPFRTGKPGDFTDVGTISIKCA